MKDGYIVLVIIGDTVEVDSIWWNEKKANNRKANIDEYSDGTAIVIKKWINPRIILSAKEYTQSRVSQHKLKGFPLISCR